MTATISKLIKKSRPNGHYIAIEIDGAGDDAEYFVVEGDDQDGVEFGSNLAAAEAYYEARRSELASTPN